MNLAPAGTISGSKPRTGPRMTGGQRIHEATRRHPKRGHHRPRRPRQDDAGRRDAPPVRPVPRQPAPGRVHPRLQRPGARARHHDPGQEHRDQLRRRPRSTSSTRPATPTSAARSSGPSRWPTAPWCWSTPSRGRCRRPSSCSARRSPCNIRPIVVINKIDRPDARPDEVLNEIFDTLRRAGGQRGAARLPLHLRLGQGRLRLARPARDLGRHPAAVRPDRRARCPAPRSTPTARSGCSARRSTSPSTSAGSRSAGSSPGESSAARRPR